MHIYAFLKRKLPVEILLLKLPGFLWEVFLWFSLEVVDLQLKRIHLEVALQINIGQVKPFSNEKHEGCDSVIDSYCSNICMLRIILSGHLWIEPVRIPYILPVSMHFLPLFLLSLPPLLPTPNFYLIKFQSLLISVQLGTLC